MPRKCLENLMFLSTRQPKSSLEHNVPLNKDMSDPLTQKEYANIMGSSYIIKCTRHDLACFVNKLSRFTSNPSDEH